MYNQKCRSTIKQCTNTSANIDWWQNPDHLNPEHPNDCGEKCKNKKEKQVMLIAPNDKNIYLQHNSVHQY